MTVEAKYFNELLKTGAINKDVALKFYKEKCEELQKELDALKAQKQQCSCKKEEPVSHEVSDEEFQNLLNVVKGLL